MPRAMTAFEKDSVVGRRAFVDACGRFEQPKQILLLMLAHPGR
jgi:hypothetical protein